MRTALLAAIPFTLAGCSPFQDDRDELIYLEHVKEPTPQQWARMKHLKKTVNERLRKEDAAYVEAEMAKLATAYPNYQEVVTGREDDSIKGNLEMASIHFHSDEPEKGQQKHREAVSIAERAQERYQQGRLAKDDEEKRVRAADRENMLSLLDTADQWEKAGDQKKAKEYREKAEMIRISLSR